MREENVNGFVNIIQVRDGGELEKELDAELRKMNKLIRIRGGSGKIALTINFKEDRNYSNVVIIAHELKVSPPPKKVYPEMMFVDPTGGLVKDSPEQIEMFDELEPGDEKVTRLHSTTEEKNDVSD
ncbi:hypothetical protein LCGC14_1704270 [marine sediment metagenome]|uniref:Uncharacterized protein n=1 Tax=marine sediment metagenome TaxID=412755 RepID=A0A0F9I4M2_9ZZZZ